MNSYYNENQEITVFLPNSWRIKEVNKQKFTLVAPPEEEHEDYSPTISYIVGKIKNSPEAFFEETGYGLEADSEEFEEEESLVFRLESGHRVWLRHYRWRDADTLMYFSQIQALIQIKDQRMALINAATLEELEDEYIPVFKQIIKSTRFGADA